MQRLAITSSICGLLLGILLLAWPARSASAAFSASSATGYPSVTSTPLTTSAADTGEDVGVFAADAGIAGAILLIAGGITFAARNNRRDRVADLAVLRTALRRFRDALGDYRDANKAGSSGADVDRLRQSVLSSAGVVKTALEKSSNQYKREVEDAVNLELDSIGCPNLHAVSPAGEHSIEYVSLQLDYKLSTNSSPSEIERRLAS